MMFYVGKMVDERYRFRPIATAQFVRKGTVADLWFAGGKIYRAVWRSNGRCVAWFMEPGQRRKKPAGLYDPEAWRPVALGIGDGGRRQRG
ncbi:MAG: hypothetical protein KGZ68_15085 [Dechloromonas sp.]|nr:hypothetical protein [Dechloromonas sp.]